MLLHAFRLNTVPEKIAKTGGAKPMKCFKVAFGVALLACMLASAAWVLTQVSPDAMIPVHYRTDGTPDRFAPLWFAVLIGPVGALVVTALFMGLQRMMGNLGESGTAGKAYWAVWALVVAIQAFVHALIVSDAIDYKPEVPGSETAAVEPSRHTNLNRDQRVSRE